MAGTPGNSARGRARSALLVGLLVTFAVPASAQQSVRGAVTTSPDGAPLEGAMVILIASERPVAQTITTASGSFFIRAPRAGRYVLRVDRIGYASTRSEPFDIATDATVVQNVEAAIEPISLRGLDVGGEGRCDVRPEAGLATATVWEEARKALAAATWTSERKLYRLSWTRYTRELDVRRNVTDETLRRSGSEVTPEPFMSVDPASLAEHGFVRDVLGRQIFTAPDPEVLLSDLFLEHHCFSVIDGDRDRADLVGLRFSPVDGRSLPEIAGAMWLDAESARLTSVDFDFVNLGRSANVRGTDARGQLTFRELPNGTWIVDEWSILMPRLVDVRNAVGRTEYYDVAGYVEEGGSVTGVAPAEASQVPSLDLAAGQPDAALQSESPDSLHVDAVVTPPAALSAAEPLRLPAFGTEPIRLAPVEVIVDRYESLTTAGFFQRARGAGSFLTPQEIETLPKIVTTDVLTAIPGVQVMESVGPGTRLLMLRRGAILQTSASARERRPVACLPRVFVNGGLVQPGGRVTAGMPLMAYDFDAIPIQRLLAVEVYQSPAETPAQFDGGSADCGVIVVWLR